MRASVGSTALGKAATGLPSRPTRYLWKFHLGCWPVALASEANSGLASLPDTTDFEKIGNLTP